MNVNVRRKGQHLATKSVKFRATRKLQKGMLLQVEFVKGRKNPRRKFVCFQSEAGKYSPRTSFNGANFRDRTRQTLNNEPAANERRSLCLECITRARRSLGDIKYLINTPIAHGALAASPSLACDRLSDYFAIGFIRKWNQRSPRQVGD